MSLKRMLMILAVLILILLLFPQKAGGPLSSGRFDQQGQEQKTKKETEKKKPIKDPNQIGARDVSRGINLYSLEKEITIGKGLAEEVERAVKLVDDPVISEYVNRVGQNLVRNSDAKVPFTIKVIDSAEVNAFALPGGFFFINTGVLLVSGSEAELASVMAHEIAHVAARHGTRQASRATLANYLSIPLIFMGGWTGYGVRQASGVLIPAAFLKFSRSFEEEADFLGLQYLYKAGYDPLAFIDFFERIEAMEKKRPGTLSKIFSSHPQTKDRTKKTQKNIRDFLENRSEYVVNTSEFTKVKERVEEMFARRKPAEKPGAPTLRKKPSGKIEPGEEGDERPTLKRRN